MGTIWDVVAWGLALTLALPALVLFTECVLGVVSRKHRGPLVASDGAQSPSIAVLVPAHDEAANITRTLENLRAQLGPRDRVIVVADNCSDDTALRAARAGASVLERHDPERRGKGYALAFGLDHLEQRPPDVVVIVDADCTLAPPSLQWLAQLAHREKRPVQADYVLSPPSPPEGLSLISSLAFLVKNRTRPRGLHALGLPCLLTGTGMAFPFEVLRAAPATRDHLVEDMVMGLELARLGHPPLFCPQAHVHSELPRRRDAAAAQRRRWEHGHLQVLFTQVPRLLGQALRKARLDLMALALTLTVPPLSLLVTALLGMQVIAFAVMALGASPGPAVVLTSALCLVACAVLLAHKAHGRDLLRTRDLLSVPLYVLWKIPSYFAFFTRRAERAWRRTERTPARDPSGR